MAMRVSAGPPVDSHGADLGQLIAAADQGRGWIVAALRIFSCRDFAGL